MQFLTQSPLKSIFAEGYIFIYSKSLVVFYLLIKGSDSQITIKFTYKFNESRKKRKTMLRIQG